jgi:hypothetical protein
MKFKINYKPDHINHVTAHSELLQLWTKHMVFEFMISVSEFNEFMISVSEFKGIL